MSRLRKLTATAVAAALFATAASAQDEDEAAAGPAEPASNQITCIAATPWLRDPGDLDRIETAPVPESFRRLFESTAPCVRWGLDERWLLNWHISFGTEQSATAALAYLEEHYRREVPRPDSYEQEMLRAWRAAQPDLRRASTLSNLPQRGASDWRRFLDRSRPYRRLRRIIDAQENYLFLAEEYLRAAEEFGSEALLRKAELFLHPVARVDRFLGSAQTQSSAAGILSYDANNLRLVASRMHAAVLRAQLTRNPADIQAAEAVLAEVYRPVLLRAAENAYQHGDFCDTDEDDERNAALREACRHEHNFQELVTGYWINRTVLDFVSGTDDFHLDNLAFRLLELEQSPDGNARCCRLRPDQDLFRLHRARADLRRRQFEEMLRSNDSHEARKNWRNALNELRRAERLATPFDAPARFRRVAEAWLELWGRASEVAPEPAEEVREFPPEDHRRYAAYLQEVLENLDAIARGADPRGS